MRTFIHKVFLTVMVMMFSMLATGCTSYFEKRAFDDAKEQNSIQAYDEFMEEYPDGEHYEEANRLQERLMYRVIAKRNSISDYKWYLHFYPNGRYSDQVRETIFRRQELISKLNSIDNALLQAKFLGRVFDDLKRKDFTDPDLKGYFYVFNKLFLTKRDIIVTHLTFYRCTGIEGILELCTDKLYAGKIFKNDIVYKDGDNVRTLHFADDLKNMKVVKHYDDNKLREKLEGNEAYGSIQEFLTENNLEESDVFHKNYNVELAHSYVPTTFIKKTSSFEGGIADFIEENPLTSLAIGAAAATVIKGIGSSDSGSNSSTSSSASTSYNFGCYDQCDALFKSCSAQCEGMDGVARGSEGQPIIFGTSSRKRCGNKCYDAKNSCRNSCM